jgi:flagellar protein FlaG
MSMQIPANLSRAAPNLAAFQARGQQAPSRERTPGQPAPPPPLETDLRQTMKNLEKFITQFNRRFEFVVDERIHRIVVKVIDRETDKVIKEIPPQEIQHLLARLREAMGLLVDERI